MKKGQIAFALVKVQQGRKIQGESDEFMSKCDKCQTEYATTCDSCFDLIDGGFLRRKLEEPRKVLLETADGKQFTGELLMVSPVGLGIKTEIVTSSYYIIKLQDILKVKAQLIIDRGRDGIYGFDIIEVQRGDNTSCRLNKEEYRALTMTCGQLLEEISDGLPDNVKQIVQERLKLELDKARILDSLQVGQTFKYQKDNIEPIAGESGHVTLPMKELIKVAEKCRKKGTHCREMIIDEKNQMFDIHGIPFDYQSGGILVLDVTPILLKEQEMKKKEKKIYHEIIEAVTGGKMLIVEKEEIRTYMAIGKTVLKKDVSEPQEMEGVREGIRGFLSDSGMSQKEVFLFLVCVSEALTNTLKHAKAGSCRVNIIPEGIRVEISDNGPGINFKDLPRATLMKNFSTKKSLGCGFTIMLQYLDRIILATDPGGTTIILEKKITPAAENREAKAG